MKGGVSAKKALQGFETNTRELLVGTSENSVTLTSIDLPSRQMYLKEKHNLLGNNMYDTLPNLYWCGQCTLT